MKRLITKFLVLAIFGSTIALALTLEKNGSAAILTPSSITNPPQNAFVEQVVDSISGTDHKENYISDKNNLTSQVSRSLAEEIIALNPEGPKVNGDGLEFFANNPDDSLSALLDNEELYRSIVQDKIKIQKEKTDPEKINIVDTVQTGNYLLGLAQVYSTYLLSGNVERLVAEPASPDGLNSISIISDQAIRELDRLSVPAELKSLHVATRDLFVRLRGISSLSPNTDDPMRTYLAYENQRAALKEAAKNFDRIISLVDFGSAKYMRSWSLIPKAHAVYPVYDLANVTQNTTKATYSIIEWIEQYLTEVMKDVLVHRLVQQTITWIQGGGKPQFVTNWKSFLKDAGNEAAGALIEQVAPRLCAPFGPLVRLSLLPVETAPDRVVACTLDQVVANIYDFANDFTQGGWVAYGASLEPQNNLFGSLIQTTDLLVEKVSEETAAAKSDAETGGGFLSTKKCLKYERVVDSEGFYTQERRCVDWGTTTPGGQIASIASNAWSAPLMRIVNAEDLAGLVNALINSALMKLFQAGEKGLASLTTSNSSASFRDLCDGLEGSNYTKCKKEVAGACSELQGADKQSCNDSIANEGQQTSACSTQETQLAWPNANGGDLSKSDGYWCKNENFELTGPASVRLVCGGTPGLAFITKNLTSCAKRGAFRNPPDSNDSVNTAGWSFDNGIKDADNNQVSFEAQANCPGGAVIVDLPAGNYSIGAYGTTANVNAVACSVGR